MDNESKRRIDSIFKFHNAKPIYFNGGVRFIDNTNLYYLEPMESILNELYSYTLIIVNIFI